MLWTSKSKSYQAAFLLQIMPFKFGIDIIHGYLQSP